jgi:hypothetical protein
LFREIPIDQYLEAELDAALARKNLTLVVADAQSLPVPIRFGRGLRPEDFGGHGSTDALGRPARAVAAFPGRHRSDDLSDSIPGEISAFSRADPDVRRVRRDSGYDSQPASRRRYSGRGQGQASERHRARRLVRPGRTSALKPAEPVITLNTSKTPPASPEKPARGRVITFYSYKSGTGRSMALAS